MGGKETVATPSRRGARTRVAAAALAGSIMVLASSSASGAASSRSEKDLLAAEDALFRADVTHDAPAVERGFADEATFVHANGMIQTKANYIDALRNHPFPIKSIETQDRVVRIFGNVGVVRGTKKLVVGDMHLSGTYLTVYVHRDGRWQMLDEQSSPALQPGGAK